MSNRSKQQKRTVSAGRLILISLLVGVWFVLSACGGASPQPGKTSSPQTATTQTPGTPIAPVATQTPLPTATPTPGRVIFLAPENADQGLAERVSLRLEELAKTSGFLFEKRSSLSATEIGADVKIVAAIPPTNNFNDLARAAPPVQFLSIGLSGLTPGSNLSLISSESLPAGGSDFLAGAMAALISGDWRTGIIVQEGVESASPELTAFTNGITYFCGLCRPALPPYAAYPVAIQLSPGASQEVLQTAVDSLAAQAVEVVYVAPQVNSPALYKALSSAGLKIIAEDLPTPELQADWAASLQFDPLPALDKIWPDLLQGKGGQNLALDLTIRPGNPAILTPGREAQAEKILLDLLNGYIDP